MGVNIDMVFLLKCHLFVIMFFLQDNVFSFKKIHIYIYYLYIYDVSIFGGSRFRPYPFRKLPDVSPFRAT
jgi:hypothetical protein